MTEKISGAIIPDVEPIEFTKENFEPIGVAVVASSPTGPFKADTSNVAKGPTCPARPLLAMHNAATVQNGLLWNTEEQANSEKNPMAASSVTAVSKSFVETRAESARNPVTVG